MAREFSSLTWDYIMFVAFVVLSTLVPLWSRLIKKKKQTGKEDYVFAAGGVSIFAMMLSIARGTLGVRSVLGYPSELYYRGSAMWEVIYGMANAYPIVCFVFVPVYFCLGITSVYQYIDLRFKSRLVRCLASGTYVIRQILSLGITVYTPSVALSAVLGIPYWASIAGISAICIFFTVVGGLKAAINADVIQSITVIAVTLTVIIYGTIESGGPQNVYRINKDTGRLKFFNFTGDLTVRVDTMSAWLGQLFMSLSQFGCQQNFMQRYVSLKSLKEVNRVMMSNIPLIFVFFSLSWLSGMVIYATYFTCDPLQSGYIQKTDEILPFYIEDRLSFIPGFLGIFMAMLFNGALCMNVSNLNSLSTVIWEDFLSQLPQFKGLTDSQQLGIIKMLALIFGIVTMGIAFGVSLLSGVIESSMIAFSSTSGPLLGVFILAMLIPVANWKGASAGMIVAHILTWWLTFGGLTMSKPPTSILPTSTEGCSNFTFNPSISKPETSWLLQHIPLEINNTFVTTTEAPLLPERTGLENFYSLSYMYYSLFGTAITVIVGVIVSYLTRTDDDLYDGKLLHPLILKMSQYLPGKKPYYMKDSTPSSEETTKTVVEHDNLGYTPNPDELVKATDFNEKNKSPLELGGKLVPPYPQNNSSSLNVRAVKHPDINECLHWEAKEGIYRKKSEKDLV